jgi:hypothetical protein
MMDPNFQFNDVLVKAHQDRLKELWSEPAGSRIERDEVGRSRIRTAAGNLLIRWGERVSGCERQSAARAARGRFAS